jgi:hypothetical protein
MVLLLQLDPGRAMHRCTPVIEDAWLLSHQARKSATARPYARRVLGFLIRAAKNSRKRIPALSPAAAISAGKGWRGIAILRGGVSWVTPRDLLEVVIYPDLASVRLAEQFGGCVV